MKRFICTCLCVSLFMGFITSCSDDEERPVILPGIEIENVTGESSVAAEDTLLFRVKLTNASEENVQWTLDQAKVAEGVEYKFCAAERGTYVIGATVVNEDGEKKAEQTVEVYGKYKFGTFVVNEGNMTTENGFVSFINPRGEMTDSVYYKVNGKALGSVVQDMYISEGKIYFVCQNGEKMDGEGSLIIADAETLEKKVAYTSEKFSDNGGPAHVAVVGKNVFVQGNSGITWLDETTETFTLVEGTKGAVRNNMAVVGEKVFASAGNAMLVLQMKEGGVNVEKVTCPGRIGGIVKADDGKLWLACGGSPSTITKVDPDDYTFLEQHQISEVSLSLSRRTSPTICAKGDTLYMKAEGDRATQIFRHIFTTNTTVQLIDMKDELENGKQGYNAINVHPLTGEVYINTILGYGWDFLVNDLTVWNFSGPEPVMKADYQNHTHFPAGVYFTYNY